MQESQRLYNIVKTTSTMLGIDTKNVEKRRCWNEELNEFIKTISKTMLSLKYFGFTEKEVNEFILGTETMLDSAIFLYLMKKVAKESTNQEEFKSRLVQEWNSPQMLDCLNEIFDIVLDAFFAKKGGISFR